MIVIVDANIIFSAIINPLNTIGRPFLSKLHGHIFISPNFLKKEILKHHSKILKITKYDIEEFDAIKSTLYHRIEFYSGNLISKECWNHANGIMKGGDEKDIPYLAMALFFESKIWTGDKILRTYLEAKGLNICINTQELFL